MIQIITHFVKMPELDQRRFKMQPKDSNGKKWGIEDTEQNRIVYNGKFENASLICYNLNKQFYKSKNKLT